MRTAAFTGLLALSAALAGCNTEPEATPDITEAIPLDEPSDSDGIEQSGAEDTASGQASDASSAPESQTPIAESGSNRDDDARQIDPARSKLLPAE